MIKKKIITVLIYTFLILGSLVFLYPVIFMFIASTHMSGDILLFPPPMKFGDYFLQNLDALLLEVPIFKALQNSFKVAVISTFLNLTISSMAGYALSKFRFKGRDLIFAILLATMMFPGGARLVPLYKTLTAMGLIDTHLAIILPSIAGVFGIFFMRQNFFAVPDSLIEAARIDGASELRIFFQVALPLMAPSLAALGIFLFMAEWSNFMWPLIVLNSEEMFTLPISLSLLNSGTRVDYGQVMVGAVITVLPILVVYLSLQKYFISGLTSGAVKE